MSDSPSSRRTRRPRARLTVAAIAVAAATALGLAGCGGSSTAAQDSGSGKVDLSSVVLHAGDQKGVSAQALLDAAGLGDTPYTIEWSQFTSGPPMLEALAAGSVDVAMVGNTPPIFAAASGSEFKVVASASYTGEGDAILVPKDSPIRSVADLAGKRVAVAPGSSANYNLLGQLTKGGLSIEDIKTDELQPSDALAAFTSGHLDAWAAWEPYVSQAQVEDGARVLVDGSNGVMNGLNFQVASDKALDDPATRAALSDYLHRIQRAQVWSGQKQHAAQWSRIWAQGAGLSPQITAKATAKRPVTTVPIDQSVVDGTQRMADAFAKAGLLPAPVQIKDWFTTDFNKVADAS